MSAEYEAHVDRVTESRRAFLRARALAHPEGLTPYAFTHDMPKADTLQFWNDARALGLIRVGVSPRGAKMFALPVYKVQR